MKRVLCLGATSAIAEQVLRLFAAQGASFFLIARNAERLDAVKGDLLSRGAKSVHSSTADAKDFARQHELVEAAKAALGGLDVAFVAHGTLGDQKAGERDASVALSELNTNFLSVVSFLTPIANYFQSAGKGRIAVIGSVAGDRGRQSNYIYGAAKGGIEVFLAGMRNRLAPHGVSVLCIKPGFVDTPMTRHLKQGPLFARPERVAKSIYHAIEQGVDVLYVPWFWRFIMFVIKVIPEAIFKRLKL